MEEDLAAALCLYAPRMLCKLRCCSHLDIKEGSGSGHVSG